MTGSEDIREELATGEAPVEGAGAAGQTSPASTAHEFQLYQLRKELQVLQNRYDSLKVILMGFVMLVAGEYFEDYTDEIWIVIFPVLSSILVVYGLYNFFLAEAE